MKTYFILDGLQKSVESSASLRKLAAQNLLRPEAEIEDLLILRESLDARKKNHLKWVYQVAVTLRSGSVPAGLKEYRAPSLEFDSGVLRSKERPIIIGAGPAGLFAAYTLLEKGYQPIILEQGKPVSERKRDVEALLNQALLNPKSNVVFGEGGAGTFSDGKLTARNRSPETDLFYKALIRFGAPGEIAYQAKPHLGTDRLSAIIPAMTRYLQDNGTSIFFDTKVENIQKTDSGIRIFTDKETWSSDTVIPAIGHSADALYHALLRAGVTIVKKTFAVGVRIEHPRTFIDGWQYGTYHNVKLTGSSDYKLTAEIAPGRGVYSFCVCPGGYIINANSEEFGVCVNGMSLSGRNHTLTNGAIVTTILPDDLPGDPLAGLAFRKQMERTAAAKNPLFAPCQRAEDFIRGVPSQTVESSYRPGCFAADLNSLLPQRICDALKAGFARFNRQIRGFVEEGTLIAPETGTSSPVRLVRDPETFEALGFKGLFPIGEGAGYAGGIVSSAADGIRLALKFAPNR